MDRPGVGDERALLSEALLADAAPERLQVAALVLQVPVQVVLVRVRLEALGTHEAMGH